MKFIENEQEIDAYTVKLLSSKDNLSVQNIWRECFTQDLNYINNFIDLCFPHSISWGIFPNGTNSAVAMLSVLPSYAIVGDSQECYQKLNGAYVYGVGTLKQFRGKGYSRKLMNEAINYSNSNLLDYILVKPAEESLFDLYERQSFDKTLWNYQIEIDLASSKNALDKANKSTQKTYNNTQDHQKLRESIGATNFLWPKNILEYSLMEIRSRNGITQYFGDSLFYCSYQLESNVQIIKVVDHNVKTIYELEALIANVATQFPLGEKAVLEFPITTQIGLFNQFISKPAVIKNSLIKILNQNSKIEKELLEKYLTLSME